MKKLSKREIEIQKDLVVRAVALHADLIRGGLYATGQKMHEVVRMAGWEMAGDVLGPERMEKARRRK